MIVQLTLLIQMQLHIVTNTTYSFVRKKMVCSIRTSTF